MGVCYFFNAMKRYLLLLLLLAATACAQSPGQQPGRKMREIKPPQREYDAIKAEMEDLAKAWNAGNVSGMSAYMGDEVEFITPLGVALKGRKELDQHHAEIMKKYFAGSRQSLTVRQIRFVRPRVAFCDVEVAISKYKSLPPGIPGKAGQPLRILTRYLLTHEGRDWTIAAVQSTLLRAPAGK